MAMPVIPSKIEVRIIDVSTIGVLHLIRHTKKRARLIGDRFPNCLAKKHRIIYPKAFTIPYRAKKQ
jgi:hypothetical protein